MWQIELGNWLKNYKHLANNGDDTVENAIALCPNCHRKAHYS